MAGLKVTISPPLEAGASPLDVHFLPPRVKQALEHVSSRLAARGQHATFLLVRRDYQLPPSLVRPTSLPAPPPPTPSSPSPARFLRRQLSDLTSRASPSSPAFGGSPRFLWPGRRSATPTSAAREELLPTPPMTPSSLWSVSTDQSSAASSSDRCCASPATPCTPTTPGSMVGRFIFSPSQDLDQGLLRELVRKAERKFQVR
jgi:hypothetical protein